MTWTAPLGLLALLAVPVIVWLHAFRNRLPQKQVAGLFLFPETAVVSDGGRTRSRVWTSPSLWLEIAAAVLLALWLAGVTFGDLVPRHVVLVLDDSASMGARQSNALAREKLKELRAGCSAGDELTVVLSGSPAHVVVGPRASTEQLDAWLPTWNPTLPGHSLTSALDLARELAGHAGEITVLTDEEPRALGPDLAVVCCGVAASNAAVASLQRLPGERSDRLIVTVVAYGGVAPFDLAVFAGEQELTKVPVSLPTTGGDMQFALAVPKQELRLRVELPADALLVDNVAWHVSEPPRVVAVCNQLSVAEYRALELPRVFDAMANWREESDPAGAQIVIRSTASEAGPGTGQLELVAASSAGAPRGHVSPFVMDRSHSLLAGVELDGVAWQSGSGNLPGTVLVADDSKVLLSEELTTAGRRIWCDLDPSAGNFVRAPDWPILFANLMETARREVPGLQQHQLRVGDELVYRCGDASQQAVLLGPDQRVLARSSDRGGALGTGIVHAVSQPGLHRVQSPSGELLAEVAVQFTDARESDLRRARALTREPAEATRHALTARIDPGPARRLLSVLLLAAVMCNWWLLRRRNG